ncbi:MAG: FAD-dependent oxidoreductase, partial [Acidimicrobiia bacterium]|nr:FAD-dependent oxidoreductase [Acidimicrobiia bacterium]
MSLLPARVDVVVVGAGVAGLAAAKHLHAKSFSVAVLEAQDDVGGRVRTDIVDGFRLDRGFQILLTAYPELRRQVDLDALDVHTFDPGALVMHRGRSYVVGDPFRAPRTFVSTLRAPIGTPLDKVRIAMLRSRTLRGDARELLGGNDLPTVVALRRAGFTIIEAENCRDGRAALVDARPDLAIVDWMLPDQSGLEFTRQLKREPEYRDLPVIMLTARAEEGDKVAGLEGGADDYITKPFSPRELVARINAVLRRVS